MVKGEKREVKEEGGKMIVVYNRGCYEDWDFYKVTSKIEAGGSIVLPGGRRIFLGLGAEVNATIRYPICRSKENNCCLKAHLNSPISYL